MVPLKNNEKLPVDAYNRIYDLIRKIPKGKIATYGQIAQLAGLNGPRRTAYALRILEDKTIPWHRIINAQGKISRRNMENMNLQRKLLIKEGIVFSKNDRVDLSIFRWNGATFVRADEGRGKYLVSVR